ncbi:MAG: hypothetical protein ACE5HU_07815 [Acidobacteriota bacterium]
MRLTRMVPGSDADLLRVVLADPESLCPGLRVLATGIPLPGQGTIDALGKDQHGAIVLLLVRLEAGAPAVGQAAAQYKWLTSNLPALRCIMGPGALDADGEPRVTLAAHRVSREAILLIEHMAHPAIEVRQVTMVSSGAQRGFVTTRVAAEEGAASVEPAPAEATGELGPRPTGASPADDESRSLLRRILEEIRSEHGEDDAIVTDRSVSGADLLRAGRLIATMRPVPGGVRIRRIRQLRDWTVHTDRQCHAAVRSLFDAPLVADQPPAQGEPAAALAGEISPDSIAVTAEEVAEFRRLSAPAGEPGAPPEDVPTVGAPGSRYVEN